MMIQGIRYYTEVRNDILHSIVINFATFLYSTQIQWSARDDLGDPSCQN